jgi:hypothetical protein
MNADLFFNNAGPCVPGDHYMLPPLSRLNEDELQDLIRQRRYFILHAPRQTGKTSTLLALMRDLNAKGDYIALYSNIEPAQSARNDVEMGIAAVCDSVVSAAKRHLADASLFQWLYHGEGRNIPANKRLESLLNHWASQSQKPIVLMLDEIDALVGDTLVSVLRQIRAGYADRPQHFPSTVILCGVRDVRDYRIHTANHEIITGGSAFNIKAESLRMGNFSRQECQTLWQLHTTHTGQEFEESIYEKLWEDTAGQPWLVNALAYELTWRNKALRDRTRIIGLEDYKTARETLIYRRDTHLDQLTDKLKEPRVRNVIAALLAGEDSELGLHDDDVQYVVDLGLVCRKPLRISNKIYQESLPRELTAGTQEGISQEKAWYVQPDNRLDMAKLLAAFQQFYREHSDIWLKNHLYTEAAPQLLLQAFLQRIVNGGGRINREYGLGRNRMDIFLEWPLDEALGFHGPVQRVVIELKILRKALAPTIAEGLQQTYDYVQHVGADEAHLMIFNRKPNVVWSKKIFRQNKQVQGLHIGVWGL